MPTREPQNNSNEYISFCGLHIQRLLHFLLCDYAKHVRTVLLSRFCLSVCPSVRPSVRLSVKRVDCDKTKAPSEKSSIMTNRKSPMSFLMSGR